MRGNALRFPEHQPTMAANRLTLLNWLHGARDEMVLKMTPDALAARHKISASPRENARQIEALLLARQAAIRRAVQT